ncbi:MAG: alpha-glucosidase, partial [Gammaproteobacteria bacterium]|nr:alpha-glucosidase [Gammaproteobacteria bacterium]
MKTRWYKNSVIYQIYPFSYKDSNGDGVGDINGIIEKLDYIRDLGVTAIWFSPLYKSPNKDYGYDIEDYYKISETFGTEEEFKRLIEECHKRGLKVIMDSVFNHTSDKHQWFLDAINNKDSKYRDYYIIRKGIKKGKKLLPPNNWTASFTGSAWERIKDTDEFYLHLFTKEQPDLNWENEEVRNEVIKVFNHYFDLGVDGFRMDVFNVFSKVQTFENTKHKSISGGGAEYFVDGPRMHEFLHELNVKSFSKYDSFIVGESFRSSEEHSSRYVDEKNEEIDALFNFSHLSSDAHMGAAFLRKKFDIIEFKKGLIDPMVKDYSHGWHTLVLENHDVPRSISRFGLDSKNYRHEVAKLLPIVTFLGYGIPFIYEGEEIGIDNHPFNSIDECKDPVSHFIYKITKKIPMPNKTRMKIISNGARDNARRPMQWNDSKFGGFSSV